LKDRVDKLETEHTVWKRSVITAIIVVGAGLAIFVGITDNNIEKAAQDAIKNLTTQKTTEKVEAASVNALNAINQTSIDALSNIDSFSKTEIAKIESQVNKSLKTIGDVNSHISELSSKLDANSDLVKANLREKLDQSESIMNTINKNTYFYVNLIAPHFDNYQDASCVIELKIFSAGLVYGGETVTNILSVYAQTSGAFVYQSL
jgi:uncharacterized protein (UPF0147 family)